MTTPLVVILMGSIADEEHCRRIQSVVKAFGITVEMRVGSAHKTAEHVSQMLAAYEADPRPKVIITVAGRSNALSGFTDGQVTAPVIACPPPSESMGGVDIHSSLRMPSGIAPAVVLEPANAALLAAKILSLTEPSLRQKVLNFQQAQALKVIKDDQQIQKT